MTEPDGQRPKFSLPAGTGAAVGRVLLLVLGVSALFWLVDEAGSDAVWSTIKAARYAVLAAFAIEGLRIGAELIGSIALIRSHRGPSVPLPWLVRSHLVAYAIGMALPAGRAASEAYKLVAFRGHIGTGPATAVATSSQGLNLVANAVVSVAAAIAALATVGAGALTLALCVHAGVSLTSGLAVLLIARSARVATWLEKIPVLQDTVRAFRRVQNDTPLFPPAAALAITSGRALQVVQFGVLAFGVGLGGALGSAPVVAMLVHGVQAVGSMAGDLVPGQVGVTEGAFRLAASAFGASAAVAVSVALMAHAVQLSWIVLGSLVPVVWRGRQLTQPFDPERVSPV